MVAASAPERVRSSSGRSSIVDRRPVQILLSRGGVRMRGVPPECGQQRSSQHPQLAPAHHLAGSMGRDGWGCSARHGHPSTTGHESRREVWRGGRIERFIKVTGRRMTKVHCGPHPAREGMRRWRGWKFALRRAQRHIRGLTEGRRFREGGDQIWRCVRWWGWWGRGVKKEQQGRIVCQSASSGSPHRQV